MTRNEAKAFIEAIVKMREGVTDEQAIIAVGVFPFWEADTEYALGFRVQRNGVLYKCAQEHTSQVGWEPENTAALWVAISLDEGTADKPITAVRGMEYEEGKYYLDTEDGNTYLCTRSGVLHYLPHELVGQYFSA